MSLSALRAWLPSEFLALLLMALLASTALELSAGLWRLNVLLLDAQLRLWTHEQPEDVVIVGIDENSLRQLGRWPWSRRMHADLLDRLSAAGARVIGFDVLFVEPQQDDMAADRALADAVARSGRVVFPVVPEQTRLGGMLVEQLPLPEIAAEAAAFGHVDVELDRDGLSRQVYLMAGLGNPHWPALALAMVNLVEPERVGRLPGQQRGADRVSATGNALGGTSAGGLSNDVIGRRWVRDYRVIVPYVGPSGHFKRVSYADVLDGRVPEDVFLNRYVLIGMTASGLADIIPTSISGHASPMPGVEFNANLVEAIRDGRLIEPMPKTLALLLTLLLTIVPLLVYPRLSPRVNLLVVLAVLAGIVVLEAGLLVILNIWFAPATALVCVLVSYPIWAWRRLEGALRYLDAELADLRRLRTRVPAQRELPTAEAVAVTCQLLGTEPWTLFSVRRGRVRGLLRRGPRARAESLVSVAEAVSFAPGGAG
ncbi:MAG: CHASE2 domain-containing protein, partial [Gammaproteobacteria bacterium]|nr:CHASE2 domain-containing protein [Gammaproteobacteria bacterium]